MPATAEQLASFLTELRENTAPWEGRDQWESTDQQFLAAHQLVCALAESNRWPESVETWRTLLAPVLCSSPLQQEQFYKLFSARFGAHRSHVEPSGGPMGPVALRTGRRVQLQALLPALLLCMVLSAFAGFVWQRLHRPAAPPRSSSTAKVLPGWEQQNIDNPRAIVFRTNLKVMAKQLPVQGATVYYLGKQCRTNSAGSCLLEWNGASVTRQLLVTHPAYQPALGQAGTSLVSLAPAGRLRSGSAWQDSFLAHSGQMSILLPSLPWVVLIAWLIRWLLRALEVRRWTAPPSPRTRKLGLGRASARLFSGPDIRKLALALRCRRPEASDEIAPEPTVEATVRQAGFFTPVHASRHREPEYLVLVQRRNARDHRAALLDELLFRLRDHDVWMDRYYFQSDPRVCVDAKGQVFALPELAALHPTHELWLACEADRCLDPVTGEPENWFATLSLWSRRALLSYRQPPRDLGVAVTPPTRAGLQTLATLEAPPDDPSPYPTLLQDLPERWLERAAPEEAARARLKTQLRRYLGRHGYFCLQATAVYPAVAWDLTKLLTTQLAPAAEAESILNALARLPWFRHGILPDWLRRDLAADLGDRRQTVLNALRLYLDAVVESQKGELELTAAPRPGKAKGEARFTDEVYLSFLWNHKIDSLSLPAPRRWRSLLYRSMLARTVAALSMAAALSAAGYWGTRGADALIRDRLAASHAAGAGPASPFVARMLDVAETEQAHTASSSLIPLPFLCASTAADILNIANPVPLAATPADFWSRAQKVPGVRLLNAGQQPQPGMVAVGWTIHLIREVNGPMLSLFNQPEPVSASSLAYGIVDFSQAKPTPPPPDPSVSAPTRPPDSDINLARPASTLEPIPTCAAGPAPKNTLSQIAHLYDQTPVQMPRGAARTARMNQLLQAAVQCAKIAGQSIPAKPLRDFQNETDGARIVDIGLAKTFPDGKRDYAVDAILHPRSAFEQYHGLLLAQTLQPLLAASGDAKSLQDAVRSQIGKTITQQYPSRWNLAQAILSAYGTETQAPAPEISVVILILNSNQQSKADLIQQFLATQKIKAEIRAWNPSAVTWKFTNDTEIHYFHAEDRSKAESLVRSFAEIKTYAIAKLMAVSEPPPARYFEIWLADYSSKKQ